MISETIEKMVDAFNKHNVEAFAAFYSPDVEVHDPTYPEPLKGKDAVMQDIQTFMSAFPDMTVSVISIVESGSEAAMEGRFGGTHKGPLPGPDGQEIAATNKRVDLTGAFFLTANDAGLITSERRYMDMAGMMSQLGLMDHA